MGRRRPTLPCPPPRTAACGRRRREPQLFKVASGTIVAGTSGLVLQVAVPECDPYQVDDVPRHAGPGDDHVPGRQRSERAQGAGVPERAGVPDRDPDTYAEPIRLGDHDGDDSSHRQPEPVDSCARRDADGWLDAPGHGCWCRRSGDSPWPGTGVPGSDRRGRRSSDPASLARAGQPIPLGQVDEVPGCEQFLVGQMADQRQPTSLESWSPGRQGRARAGVRHRPKGTTSMAGSVGRADDAIRAPRRAVDALEVPFLGWFDSVFE